MFVIDLNTSIGKRVDNDPRYSPMALCEELDRHQVAAAFTYSQRGIFDDYRAGNREAALLNLENPRLIPVAILDPRDSLGWDAEWEWCREEGIKAIRFFPVPQRWTPSSALFRRLLKTLSGSGVALMFSSIDSYTGWDVPSVIAEMTADLGLPVIFMETYYANMVEVLEVLKTFPHTYMESNGLATTDAIDTVVGEVGAQRILYGSAAPDRPMQKSLNQVLEARISDSEKAAILGKNAAHLFSLPPALWMGRPQLAHSEPKIFEEEIIDVHSHLGFWLRPPYEDYNPTGMLERMKRYNISHGIVSSADSMRYDIGAGNSALAKAIADHPELRGYVEVNPWQFELSCTEMNRYFAQPNFVGAEIELTHIPCPTGSLEVRALMGAIASHGKPVLFMPATGGDAAAERELGRAFPHLSIIHAHGFDAGWARVVADTPNIHVEFCLSRPSHLALRECIDILGPQRVLFGTDQTLLSVGAEVGLYLDARLSAAERRLILRDNAKRLFNF